MFPEMSPRTDVGCKVRLEARVGDLSHLIRVEAQQTAVSGVHLRDKVELFDTNIRARGEKSLHCRASTIAGKAKD